MSMRLKMVKVRLMRRMLIVMRMRLRTVQSLRTKKKISMSCSGSTLERVLNLE